MRHVLYAFFESRSAAQQAVARVRDVCGDEATKTIFHRTKGLDLQKPLHLQKLDIDESDAGPALLRGILLGGLAGLVVGFVLVMVLGLPTEYGLIYGLVAGAMFGGLASFLVGLGLPDRQLRRIDQRSNRRQVLVTFETTTDQGADVVTRILEERGARIAEKKAI